LPARDLYTILVNLFVNPKTRKTMKTMLSLFALMIVLASCSRAVTPGDAANHHYKNCRNVK